MIEFLFSLVIFGIVLGSALASLQSAQRFSEDSRQRLVAMDVARTVLETMKNPELDLDDIPDLGTTPEFTNLVQAALPNGGSITIDWRLASSAYTWATTPYATYTVSVYWIPMGSTRTAPCARVSNIPTANPLSTAIDGCKNIEVTTIRSRFT